MAVEGATQKENHEAVSSAENMQPKSDDDSGSKPGSRLGFEVKASRKKKRASVSEDNEGFYKVTFTVTIAQAVPTVKSEVESSSAAAFSRMSRGTSAPGTADEESDGRASRRKRVMEAPRAQNLYHLEYVLVPDDLDQTVKTDLVTFGVAAKIFTEKQEAKVLKTWVENDQTWVAWTHCHTIAVTEDLLKKMFTHSMQLRIWDTRDKVSTRAKMDRPRAFKFPPVKAGDDHTGGVKTLVLKQSKCFEKMQPKRSYIDRPLPSHPRMPFECDPIQAQIQKEVRERVANKKKKAERTEDKEAVAKGHDYLDNSSLQMIADAKAEKRSHSRVSELAEPAPKIENKHIPRPSKTPSPETSNGHPPSANSSKKKKSSPSSGHKSSTPKPHSHQKHLDLVSNPPSSVGSQKPDKIEAGPSHANGEGQDETEKPSATEGTMMSTTSQDGVVSGGKRKDKKKEREAAAQADHVKKHGKCCVTIRMAKFFTGVLSITERLEKPVDTVPDLLLSVSINKPIMSNEMTRKLNPLVVKVHSATKMPDDPLPYDELKIRCWPAYVKYNFFHQGEHCSVGRQQDKSIYWDDVNVVLAGTMEPSELREYLSGPPMEIEVHDRDRIQEKHKLIPTLFGDDLEDEKISNVGTVGSKRTLNNPFDSRNKPWDPYGVAKFDLSDLLLGQQILHVKAPIHNCALPDVLGIRDSRPDGKLVGVPGAVDGPVDAPLQQGKYLESSAMLKIKVEVAHPIITPSELAAKLDTAATPQCPFARILFKFEYKNVQFLHKVQSILTEINSRALGLEDMPPHVIEAALSTYKLSLEQQRSRDLDIVSGFHVMDGVMHMFVLEGLRDEAIRYIWDSLPKPSKSNVEVLYNSDLNFCERIYGPLDVDVCRIKLHEQLSVIVQQPLLYVRDMVPKPCFEALVKLDQLTKCEKLRDAWRADIFPSADMVISMSREFGVPITADDFEELTPHLPKIQEEATRHYAGPTTSRVWTPIDNYNDSWLERVAQREQSGIGVNFDTENKGLVRERSNLNRLHRSKTMPMTVKLDCKVPHNYSSQSRNSTELAKDTLRQLLSQEPGRRFTLCQDYLNSMTVVPVNIEAQRKAEAEAHRRAFKTVQGWTYPGKKTFQQSNIHPQKPHTSRVKELQEPWRENVLHAKLRPVLERERYTWGQRNEDIDIWTKPNLLFGNEPSTIHLAGEKLKQEQLAVQRTDHETWNSKVVVTDPRSYFHRCATDTELTQKGPQSSNQIDRLRGALKDPPQKYSLKKPGLALKETASLHVVLNPSVDTEARKAGRPIRPAVDNEFDQKVRGLNPGPFNELSWNMDNNVIPAKDYDHKKFIDAKGNDFSTVHQKERSGLYKRKVALLTENEYDTHLFRVPPHIQDFRGRCAYFVPTIEEQNQDWHCAMHEEPLETRVAPDLEVIREAAAVEG